MTGTTLANCSLVESLRYAPVEGYFLLQRHLERLQRSAKELSFECDVEVVRARLDDCSRTLRGLSKVRVEVSQWGEISITAQPIGEEPLGRFAVATAPVTSSHWALAHKTTERTVYDDAFKGLRDEVADVVLWNERGELTETCRGNLVVQDGKHLLTPPTSSGLLPGTFRAHLLSEGKLREAVLYLNGIQQWQALYRINSVRLWTRIELVSSEAPSASALRS